MRAQGTERPPTAPRYVCRCEEIAEDEIVQAIAEGASNVNDVKRRTRAGMGMCQGIFCVRPIAELLRREAGLPAAAIEPMTARPPVRPVPLGLLTAKEE
jgi:bacterioferritin-associated ferredoxin